MPWPLQQISCSVFILTAHSWTIRATMLYITPPTPELMYPVTKLWTSDLLHLIPWFTSLFGKNTSSVFLKKEYIIYAAAVAAKSLQSCPTLCDPIDGSPPGSPIPGILQARTLEWVAISFSNAWKWKVKVKSLSHVLLLETPWTAAYIHGIFQARVLDWSAITFSIYSVYICIYTYIFNYYMSENMFFLSLHLTDRLLKHSVTWKSFFSHNCEGTGPLSLSFPYCCWYQY